MPAPDSQQKNATRPVTTKRDDGTTTPVISIENDRVLHDVRRVLSTLHYGSVTLIVQDGRVVQVDTTSKLRLAARGGPAGRTG
jgi:hypothetical protein